MKVFGSAVAPETLNLILVNLAGIMERADESLLPGVYKEVGAALHADPTRLGSLTLFRSIVQCSCYPLAAYLAVRHNRAHIIAIGAFLWAGATFLVALSSTFLQVAISRGLNGIGLAIVIPAIQSLIADSTDESNRGLAFGWLQLTGNIGSILGNLFAVLIASTTVMGIPGWRVSFHLVGLISVLVGVLVWLFAKDPHFNNDHIASSKDQSSDRSFMSGIKDMIKEAKSVIRIPTFQIFVAQGVSGTFPWSALSFATMWLELIGFSHKKTALLMTLFSVAGSFGGLFGGRMGDILAKRFPNSGRIVLSQISSGSAIPLAAILLLALPDDPSTAFSHGLVLIIMGFCISWNGPATNNPIFAEIVPEKSRTSVYALDRSFETVLASFAPPVVGMLAQNVYGYKPVPATSSDTVGIETDRDNATSLAKALYTAIGIPFTIGIETDRDNATSLAKALYTAIGIPFTICCIIYSFLYCTYPRDRDRARMQALVESEMGEIGSVAPRSGDGYCDLKSVESRGLDGDERCVIEVEYGEDASLEFDHDNDDKALLARKLTLANIEE